ncbi:MAG: c-type cytochrome [Methylophilaceae bacterium]
MKTINWILLSVVGMITALPTMADENAAKLDRQQCSICHGAGGTTTSELFPQLAGQPAPYFINQMKAFRDKTRSEENARRFMWGISSRLSDEDIQSLATFYEGIQPSHMGKISDTAKYELGKNIFLKGKAEKGVPACMSCHGEKGEGIEATPRLGGQHEAYLKKQLKVFYGSERPAAMVMHEIVKGLSEADTDAIAHYLQAQ